MPAQRFPWLSAEQALLLRAAIGRQPDAVQAFTAWRATVDIEAPVDDITFRLLPLAAERMRALGADDAIQARLKGVARRVWYDNNTMLGAAAGGLRVLGDGGISTLAIGAAAIALTAYRNAATRPVRKLDVVVHPTDRDAAVAILTRAGWRPTQPLETLYPEETHLLLARAPIAEIDLHWRVLSEAPSDSVDAFFWDDAKPFDLLGAASFAPSATALLAHALLAGARCASLEPPGVALADCAQLIAAGELDWAALARFARAHRLTYRMHLTLAHLRDVYGVEIPVDVLASLKAPKSLAEIVENRAYLGDSDPGPRAVLEYAGHLREADALSFVAGYARFLQKRWSLPHPALTLFVAAARATRRLIRVPA